MPNSLNLLIENLQRNQTVSSIKEDHFRVSFANNNIFPFKLLVCFMCQSEEDVNKAMYTDELRRARELADLMSKQYFIQGAYPGKELKVSDIETLLLKEDRVVL